MTKVEEKKEIVKLLSAILTASISVMEFYKIVALDDKSREICDKSIDNAKKGIEKIKEIKHIEILRSLMNHIIVGKEPYYAMCGSLCSYEKIDFWDKTKKGFNEFMKLEELGRQEELKKQEEIKKNKEIIKKAQEEGKNVEMLYDKDTKTIKPIIVEEKHNA